MIAMIVLNEPAPKADKEIMSQLLKNCPFYNACAS